MSSATPKTTAADITQATLRSFAQTPEPRTRRLLEAAVKHLHAFATEVNLTTNELIRLAEILTAAGKISDASRHEFLLISDIMGLNGRRVIEALIAGERNPRKLVALTDRRLKATPKELYDALHGRLTDHHRFLLQLHLRQYDGLDEAVRQVDREAEARLSRLDQRIEPKPGFRDLTRLLVTIPGVSYLSALTILSEIGADMSRFATAGHLVAWAGLCPGQNESAGKRRRSRLRKGAPWLKTMLVQCAWAAKRAKTSYYRAQFFRLQAKRGPQKAICAVAASILTAIYHMLKNGAVHVDLGASYFDARSPQTKLKRLVRQFNALGFEVTLQPIAKAS